MKIALATFKIEHNIDKNIEKIVSLINKIITEQDSLDMILFPEDCLTALKISDIPQNDINLGLELSSDKLNPIIKFAKSFKIHIGFGFLELVNNKLFDSYIVIDDTGKVIFNHKRIHKGWLAPNADESFYGSGNKLTKFETKFGSFVILLCGEIFDEQLIENARNLETDYLINPLLRADDNFSQEWLNQEISDYALQVKKTKSTGLLVNGITTIEEAAKIVRGI